MRSKDLTLATFGDADVMSYLKSFNLKKHGKLKNIQYWFQLRNWQMVQLKFESNIGIVLIDFPYLLNLYKDDRNSFLINFFIDFHFLHTRHFKVLKVQIRKQCKHNFQSSLSTSSISPYNIDITRSSKPGLEICLKF